MLNLKEFLKRKSLDELFERPDRKETGIPFIVKYHPCFHNICVIIRINFTFLYAKGKIQIVFISASFISFCSGYCLRNHLVRAKVYPLIRKNLFIYFVKEIVDVKLVVT